MDTCNQTSLTVSENTFKRKLNLFCVRYKYIYIYTYCIYKYSTINTIMNHKATNPLSLLLISVFLLMLCINVYTTDTRQQYSAQQLLLLVLLILINKLCIWMLLIFITLTDHMTSVKTVIVICLDIWKSILFFIRAPLLLSASH